ncbi:MAG: hypothetical protein KIT41_14280 [Pyrinomonadaceae bacterium]|nr:hypothetical protein [Pyrinomonadaceae bacterium]
MAKKKAAKKTVRGKDLTRAEHVLCARFGVPSSSANVEAILIGWWESKGEDRPASHEEAVGRVVCARFGRDYSEENLKEILA